MENYISYKKAEKVIDPRLLKKERAGHFLDICLRLGEVFYFVKNGEVFFEIESLKKSIKRSLEAHGIIPREKRDESFPFAPYSISSLQVKKIEGEEKPGSYLIPILNENIVLEHCLDENALAESLNAEGKFEILSGTCGIIDCCGLYVEVKHPGKDIAAWTSVYYQDTFPRSFISGFLVEKNKLNEIIEETRLKVIDGYYFEDLVMDEIAKRGEAVQIAPPLYFSKNQLRELTKSIV
jgi:hypothetical protein